MALVLGLTYTATAGAQSIQNPRRIAEGPGGQLLVSDRSGFIVAVDKSTLQPLWSFQLPAEGAPFGLATSNRHVFVGNTETGNVEVYRLASAGGGSKTLRFSFNLGGTPPGEIGTIQNPISIDTDRKAKLVFVLDGAAKKIKVFDRKGAFLYEFDPVDQDGAVLSPVSLEVDALRGELLVADYGDPSGSSAASEPARILIYDYTGTLLDQIDGSGFFGSGFVFRRVQGMASSADGRIFAADPLGSRILVFDRSSGELNEVLGTKGSEPGQLMIPTDVLLDRDSGDLFIVNNRGGRRVEVIRGAGG
jgi:DNA-binding beta-propeller fold protein YncE